MAKSRERFADDNGAALATHKSRNNSWLCAALPTAEGVKERGRKGPGVVQDRCWIATPLCLSYPSRTLVAGQYRAGNKFAISLLRVMLRSALTGAGVRDCNPLSPPRRYNPLLRCSGIPNASSVLWWLLTHGGVSTSLRGEIGS